jgi:hypothetical protein
MTLTLRDRTEITLSREKGERLKEILLSDNRPEYIELDHLLVRVDQITKLDSTTASSEPINKQLSAPDYRGTANETIQRVRKKLQEKMVI